MSVCACSALPNYVSLSFPTISSSGPNGAVIHYRPEAKTARILSVDELYLCDSGGQYYDGTTDVTRTVSFGTPSKKEKVSHAARGYAMTDGSSCVCVCRRRSPGY